MATMCTSELYKEVIIKLHQYRIALYNQIKCKGVACTLFSGKTRQSEANMGSRTKW